MKDIVDFIENIILKYHSCQRNSDLVTQYKNTANNSYWTKTVYKCRICGKTHDYQQ